MGHDGPMFSSFRDTFERDTRKAEEYNRQQQRAREEAERERRRRADRNRMAYDALPSLLQRYDSYLHTRLSPTLNSALFQWLEETPENYSQHFISWSQENDTAHHSRSVAIEKALILFQHANEASKPRWFLLIDLLLGPRLQEAKAKAHQAFFNPQQHFYHTVLAMVVKLIQDKLAQNKQKNAPVYEGLTTCFQSYPLLEKALSELVHTYQHAFPFMAQQFETAMTPWFSWGKWQCSLMELVDNLRKTLSFGDITLETYTLELFQNQAFFAERKRYEKVLAHYLQQHPDDIAFFLEAAHLSQDASIGSTDEERHAELIQYFSFLPAQMPWAFSDHYMNQGHAPAALYDMFLAHGADISHLKPGDAGMPQAWSTLKGALRYACSQSPLDVFVLEKLQTYCQQPHETARWFSIVEALSDTNTHTPLAKRLLDTCKKHEKYHRRSSRLLSAAKEAQNYLHKPLLKPVLLSFYACFEENEPAIDVTSIHASMLAENPLPPEITTLVVEAYWFKRDTPSIAIQRLAASFPRFQHLSFSNIGLTDEALHALMHVWGYIENPRKTIETLDLSHNLLTDDGLKKIAPRLSWWPALHTLNLSGNLITSEGVEALLSILPQTALTTISLGQTTAIEESLQTKLAAQLALNAKQSPKLDLTPETSDKISLLASTLSGSTLSEADITTEQVNDTFTYMTSLPGFSPNNPDVNLGLNVDTPFPVSPAIRALQTQLQKNQQQHEDLAAVTHPLDTPKDTLIPLSLTPPPLRTLKHTVIASSHTKNWYHLLPVKGNTVIFDFSREAFLRAESLRHYFFNTDTNLVGPLVSKPEKRYHDHFCGMLYFLFTLAKDAKENWSLNGIWAFPFQKIAAILSRLTSHTNEVGFILYVADFLHQHYVHTGKAQQLTENKALIDVLSVLQWMHDNDTPEAPLVQLLIHQKLQVQHLSLLLKSCMGETSFVMAVPTHQLASYQAMITDALAPEVVFQNSPLPLLTIATPKPLTDAVAFEDQALPEWIITFPAHLSAEETCEATWSPVLQQLYQRRYPETVLTLLDLVPTGNLTLTHIEHLAKAIPEGGKIRKLDANGMQFTPETWQAFCGLISHWNQLKELHLEKALNEGALQVLAPHLENLQELTTLNISDNAGHITPADMVVFLPKLPRCKQLQSLHMSYNALTDEMLDLLWRNLPCLKRLAEINLSANHLTLQTIKQFEQQKSEVIFLTLENNKIELTEINLLSAELDKRKLEQWDSRLREMVSKDAKNYKSRNSKTPFFMRQFHGGVQSLTHAQDLVEYDTKKSESDKKTFYFLEKLRDYFLDESISSMSVLSLDTPLASDITSLFGQAESPLLEGFYEQLQALSTTDPIVRERARKNTPFYVNALPNLFAEQYQRCLERARLGVSIDNRLKGMDKEAKKTLQSLPRNKEQCQIGLDISTLQKAQQDTYATVAAQGKRIVTLTEEVTVIQTDILALKQAMKEVKAQLAALEKKYELLDSAVQIIQLIKQEASNQESISDTTHELITHLQAEQERMLEPEKTLVNHEKIFLVEKLNMLQEQVNRHGSILENLRPSSIEALSSEKAAYVTHFQQTVFQLYLAALMVSTGLFSYHSDGTLGKASKMFKSLGNIIPFVGSGMKLLSSLLKTTDKKLLQRRMNRLIAMGGFFEVMALSERLAMRLFDIDLPNPLDEDVLDNMLSAAGSATTAAEEATSFIQGIWQVVETTAGDFISNLLAKPKLTKIEKRAEQDANLFLARLCKEGMPHCHALYLSATAEALPRPETLVIYWIEANMLGCYLPDGQNISTLNEAGLGRYYASLSYKAQRESQLITLAEEQVVNECVAQTQSLPKASRFTTLLFYAIPLFVVADEIFRKTLMRFCALDNLSIDWVKNRDNPKRRKEWCENLTYTMNCYTSQIQEPLSEPKKREIFVEAIAKEYEAVESSIPSASALARRGLFHLKPKHNKPEDHPNQYVSMHPNRCTPEAAEAVLKRVTLNRR